MPDADLVLGLLFREQPQLKQEYMNWAGNQERVRTAWKQLFGNNCTGLIKHVPGVDRIRDGGTELIILQTASALAEPFCWVAAERVMRNLPGASSTNIGRCAAVLALVNVICGIGYDASGGYGFSELQALLPSQDIAPSAENGIKRFEHAVENHINSPCDESPNLLSPDDADSEPSLPGITEPSIAEENEAQEESAAS